MVPSLSLYEFLATYTGEDGLRLSMAQFEALVRYLVRALPQLGVRRVAACITPDWLQDAPHLDWVLFAQRRLPFAAQTIVLPRDDLLFRDRFLWVMDAQLPFVLVARSTSTGVLVLISTEADSTEAIRLMLSAYPHMPSASAVFTPESHTQAGRLLAALAQTSWPEAVVSWLRPVMLASAAQQLEQLRSALGVAALTWHNRTAGAWSASVFSHEIPVAGAALLQVGTSQAQLPQALANRCRLAAGYLSNWQPTLAQQAQPTVPPSPSDDQAQAADAGENLNSILAELSQNPLLAEWGLLPQQDPPDSQPSRPSATSPAQPTQADAGDFPQATPAPMDGDMLQWLEQMADEPTPPPSQPPAATEAQTDDVLRFISQQLHTLRDGVLDRADDGGQTPMQHFFEQSDNLLLLIDEIVYINSVVGVVRSGSEHLNLELLANTLVVTYVSEFERQGIAFTCWLPEQLPPIRAHAESLNRSMSLLIDQALQAVQAGGRVEIGVFKDAQYVGLYISADAHFLDEQDHLILTQAKLPEQINKRTIDYLTVATVVQAHNGHTRIEEGPRQTHIALYLPR